MFNIFNLCLKTQILILKKGVNVTVKFWLRLFCLGWKSTRRWRFIHSWELTFPDVNPTLPFFWCSTQFLWHIIPFFFFCVSNATESVRELVPLYRHIDDETHADDSHSDAKDHQEYGLETYRALWSVTEVRMDVWSNNQLESNWFFS